MIVRAIKMGYYTHLRHIGDVFEINDEVNQAGEVIAFSKVWMEQVTFGGSRAGAERRGLRKQGR